MKKTSWLLLSAINITGLVLFLSWYLPMQHGYWKVIDEAIFSYFNHLIVERRYFAYLVAITNYRAFDMVSLLMMGLLYYYYWCRQPEAKKMHYVAVGFTMLMSAVVINQLGHLLPIVRSSPSLYFTSAARVDVITGMATKGYSSDSFPGDHGIMLLIFAGFMLRYFGHRAFLKALAISVVFSLPRIMSGAHWFTDIAVGSLSLVLVGLGWVLLTPISYFVTERISPLLNRLQKKCISFYN